MNENGHSVTVNQLSRIDLAHKLEQWEPVSTEHKLKDNNWVKACNPYVQPHDHQ